MLRSATLLLLAATSGAPGAVGRCGGTPEAVRLQPTQQAPGSRGRMLLLPVASPFGVAVDRDGRRIYRIAIEIQQLRRRPGAHYVAWVATPELDQALRLGPVGEDGRVEGLVSWNKFLVFVSEEPAPGAERWSGPILLTGLSPSGRMHTMAGHGPFEGMNCQDFYN